MSRKRAVILILVGTSFMICLLLALSLRVAKREVSELLSPNEVISKTKLTFAWPPHWHFVIDTLYTEDFFHGPNEVSYQDQELICISLNGDHLRAFPARPNDVDLVNVLWNTRKDCVYGRGTNWVIEKNPMDGGGVEDGGGGPSRSDRENRK